MIVVVVTNYLGTHLECSNSHLRYLDYQNQLEENCGNYIVLIQHAMVMQHTVLYMASNNNTLKAYHSRHKYSPFVHFIEVVVLKVKNFSMHDLE